MNDQTPPQPPKDDRRPRPLSRRSFLLGLGALSGGAALLAACGGTSSTATTASAPSAAPSAAPAATTAATTGAAATAPTTATSATAATAAAATTMTTGSATTAATSASPTVASAATASRATTAATASGTAQDASPAILAAANAFIATLSDAEKKTGMFAWTDTAQKQRWSNLPNGAFQRAGLMWGNLNATAQNAWLALMQATLSAEGYARARAEWAADDALGGGMFGMQYYYLALIGTPSASDPWQWQWGGHHVTVNATIVGPNVSLTPSFIGVQPATYTDTAGKTVRPLGDIEDAAFALLGTLDATQQKAAILGSNAIDLVLGPGQDGKTIQAEGLPGSQMNASQQDAFVKFIGLYTNLVNGEDAAARNAEIKANLAQTYLAWYGPTTKGSAAYVRVTGPTVVIEYSPQGGGGGRGGATTGASTDHIHGIYRDPTNDYGAKYTGLKVG